VVADKRSGTVASKLLFGHLNDKRWHFKVCQPKLLMAASQQGRVRVESRRGFVGRPRNEPSDGDGILRGHEVGSHLLVQ